ncbi:MAG: O-antigen ligase domain-containing protein [Desulfobacteraceae bacterium]|nr:O-antigen ligase domain-containing protein [Desulfobacteraceae bacterium]
MACISMLFSNHKPHASGGLFLLLTYIAAYCITQMVVQTRKEQRILIYTIVITALFLSIFGLFKRFGINPFAFWVYDELKYQPDFLASTYGNYNHMAGFIEMALPFLLVLFLTRTRNVTTIFIMIYLSCILMTAQALTLSRGGWISTLGGLTFMISILYFHRRFKKKKLVLTLLCITLAISILLLASPPVVERAVTITQKDVAGNLEARIKTWEGTVDLIKDHPYTGSGPGTYAMVFPRYQLPGLGVQFQKAHNDYLHFIADIGLLIVPIMGWILFVFFKTGFCNLSHSSRQIRGIALAAMTSVVAILIHSISDFNLHIPANALTFIIIAGMVKKEVR